MKLRPSTDHGPVFASVVVAADLAGVTKDTLFGWIADGLVRSERIRKVVYVNLDDVMANIPERRPDVVIPPDDVPWNLDFGKP